MRIIESISLLRNMLRVKNSLKEADMNNIKSGITTSEFWLALLGSVLPVLNGKLGLNLPTEAIISIAGVIVSYVLGRSAVKRSAAGSNQIR